MLLRFYAFTLLRLYASTSSTNGDLLDHPVLRVLLAVLRVRHEAEEPVVARREVADDVAAGSHAQPSDAAHRHRRRPAMHAVIDPGHDLLRRDARIKPRDEHLVHL